MRIKFFVILLSALCLQWSKEATAIASTNGYGYSLESTLVMAIENDPWLKKSQYQEKSLLSEGLAASSLPDPKASVSMANLPVDDFSFNSQPMTQFKLGLSQTFARGDSLELKGDIKNLQAGVQPYLRANRKTQLMMQVGSIWLDAYKAQKSIELIRNKKHLFQELKEAAEINYRTAIQSSSQQELVRADLELSKLDDQITVHEDNLHRSIRKLSEYMPLPQSYLSHDGNTTQTNYFSSDLPSIQLLNKKGAAQKHPLVVAMDHSIASSAKMVDLKKQGYKPQFTLSGSYGLRNDAPGGEERPDFFSLGVSFDIPLFTENKQDKEVEAAVYKKESRREERALIINKLVAGYDTQISRLDSLNKRLNLYRNKIFPQIFLQGEASMTAYSNNEADFAELVRARIDEVNAQLTVLDIAVEIQKAKLRANYYQAESSKELLAHIGINSNLSTFKKAAGDSNE
ncbi:TolC family protein [Kangiella shandongensis]|uniref:TolC family protein n=1 Tax=Kangiella shandongensis TaxID=2763258 RepID=UPI001CBA8055|nr:TolC family protein [Kangiella shandongensis]